MPESSLPALAPPEDAMADPVASVPTYRTIVRLAVPLALANAFALGAQWIIVVLIGHYGAAGLYVRSLYLPVAFILSAFQVGIDISTLVAVARHRANTDGDPRDLGAAVRPMAAAGLAVIAVAAAVVILGAGPLGHLLGVRPGIGDAFVPFVRLMCVAVVLEIPCMVLTAALRGSGHPGSASLVAVAVMVLQVAGVALVGGVLGLGVDGFPIAVAASGLGGLALAAAFLHRYGLLASIRHATPSRPPGGVQRAMAVLRSVGIPVGGTFVVLFLANGVTLRVLAGYGATVVSGYGIANTTQIVVIVPAIGLGTAIAILINQGGPAAVLATVRRGAVLAATLYAALGALIWLGAGPIARVASPDAGVAAVTEHYLRVIGPTLACVGTMLTALTVLEQTGSGFVALAFNLCYFGLGIAIGALLAHRSGTYRPLFATMAVANVVALIVVAPIVTHRTRKLAVAPADIDIEET